MNKKQLMPVLIPILFLLSGCASGMFSVKDGNAKLSIPFDFPKPQKQENQEKKIPEETEELKEEMASGKKSPR